MTKRWIICLSMLVWSVIGSCEGRWAKTYFGGIVDLPGNNLAEVDDGCIMVGTFRDGWSPSNIPIVLKLDKYGNIMRSKELVLEGSKSVINISGVQLSPYDGGFFVVCCEADPKTPVFYVIKIDKDWDIEWQRYYSARPDLRICSTRETSDGGLIILGSMGANALFALKFGRDSQIQWQKEYGGDEYYFLDGSSIYQTKSGDFVVVGIIASLTHVFSQAWLMKLNSDGCVLWQKILFNENNDMERIFDCRPSSDGGFVLLGGNEHPVVVKLDKSGDIEWQSQYYTSCDVGTFGIELTSDKGLLLTGYFLNCAGIQCSSDIFMLKLSETGTVLWGKKYGSGADEYAGKMIELHDGSLAIGGVQSMPDWGSLLLVSTNRDGNLDEDCGYYSDMYFHQYGLELQEKITFLQMMEGCLGEGESSFQFKSIKGSESTICSDIMPCLIRKVVILAKPFRLKIKGENFHKDVQIFIGPDAAPWNDYSRISPSELILKKGSALKAMFPKGVPVEIKLVNGDGGQGVITFTR